MEPYRTKRIRNQYEYLLINDQTAKVRLVDDNIYHWIGTIKGPHATAYQGGIFQIDVQFPQQYPYKPPKMKFITKVWHPNISSATGAIGLDILSNQQYSPALMVRALFLSVQALMSSPEPNEPQDAVVANQYKQSIQKFHAHVQQWVIKYALPETNSEKLKRLVQMGFPQDIAAKALLNCRYDQEEALESLIHL